MVNEPLGRGVARRERLIERFEGERRLQMAGERPAHHFARERVDHDGQIDEVLGEPDIGDVGDPELIEASGTQRAREVRPDREAVPAVARAGNEGSCAQAQQVVLVHQPQHAFGVDDEALSAERLRDAAIAVVAMGERFALDKVAQIGVLTGGGVRAEMAVVAGARHLPEGAQAPDVGVVLGKALRLERDHFFNDRVEVGAPPSGLVASQSRKASRKKCRSAC